jgi:hypothetical protein
VIEATWILTTSDPRKRDLHRPTCQARPAVFGLVWPWRWEASGAREHATARVKVGVLGCAGVAIRQFEVDRWSRDGRRKQRLRSGHVAGAACPSAHRCRSLTGTHAASQPEPGTWYAARVPPCLTVLLCCAPLRPGHSFSAPDFVPPRHAVPSGLLRSVRHWGARGRPLPHCSPPSAATVLFPPAARCTSFSLVSRLAGSTACNRCG